ncbi:MAG: HIT family protein [Treponema sp.]|jgi:histidine triad (HIT) family protein|nr:HIT family protein [Treponema sp.]
MNHNTDCIFCKILAGEIPSYKIYENDHVYAFLDVAEDADGHTLVIPKKHCRNVLDAEPEELSKTLAGVQAVARHYVKDCGYDGASVVTFAEPCAGQSVFHWHFHVYPRKNGDGLFVFPKFKKCTRSLSAIQKLLQFS